MRDLARNRQRVAGEHLHRNAQATKLGDELFGVWPGRIKQSHQAKQCRRICLGAARYRQGPIALQGRFADLHLQRPDRRGQESAGFGDGAHGAFHHAQPLAVLFNQGFSPPVFCVKWRKGDRGGCWCISKDAPRFCCSEECLINWILICLLGGECASKQYVGLGRVLQGNHAGDGQLIHRDRPCLVHAEHVHRRSILGGAEARDQHAAFRQLFRADRHADCEHHRQGDRHCAHQQHKHQRNHVEQRHMPDQRQHDHHTEQHADDDE